METFIVWISVIGAICIGVMALAIFHLVPKLAQHFGNESERSRHIQIWASLPFTVEYTVIFDVVESGYRQWWFPALGLLFIAASTVLIVFRKQLPARGSGSFPFILLGFAVLWTVSCFVVTFRDYSSLASDLRSGRCNVIEGIVTDFDPKLKSESFRVGDQRFEYSDSVVTAGFNNMQSQGGPVRDGMPIRIHHVGNAIARLEVAR